MATRMSSERVGKNSSRFTSVLASAVLEWFLICMLLLDAFFSYLVTKFARVCELQTPCLLCSRLDHILGSEKPGFYRDLICHSHKLEISKLVYCYIHEKLSDGHGMCEGCISSITTDKKSDGGAYKSSASKAEPYIEYCVDDAHNICLKSPAVLDGYSAQISLHQDNLLKDPLLKVPTLGASSMELCSCSTEPWSKTQRLLRTKSIGDGAIELDGPSSGMMVYDHLHCQDGFKKRREKLSVSTMESYLENREFDRMPYIGYTELKITSNSESEVPVSGDVDDDDDDDDRSSLVCNSNNLMEESVAQCLQPEIDSTGADILPKTMFSDSILDKLNDQTFMPGHSLSVRLEKFHMNDPHDSMLVVSPAAIGKHLKENCNQDESRDNPPAVSILISSDKFSSSNKVKESLAEVNKEKHVLAIGDAVCICHTENTEVSRQGSGSISTNSSVQINHTVIDPGSSMPSCMELNNVHKLAADMKGSQPSATFTELQSTKDSAVVLNNDLKLLRSQMEAVQGFEFSWGDMSPRFNTNGDDSKMIGTSTVNGLQILLKRCSIERNESGLESLDGSLVCDEIEGENAVDRLKQQIEMDCKSMNALYKELEEERSASAIAANQAMAMINRLQEERAAVQMEAFQYQRMMEEQADYDQSALQKANDLLTDREKEIQDLEEELETYRKMYPSDLWVEKASELRNDSKGREMRAVLHENNTDYKAYKTGIQKDTLLDFEGENFYISKCSKSLENKLRFSYNGISVDSSELDSKRGGGSSDDRCVDMTIHVLSEDQDQPLFADNLAGNCRPPQMESHAGSDVEDIYSTAFAENNVVSIWKQISHVNERLKTLEEDRDFLEQTVSTLRNGNEGFHFVQEISSHL
ncbi:myosin-binding protein 1-like protein isoform X1 [Cinnamomum micranthum f. kanehirae]|uniref:Myosin-binding protein 1-like protein isoform X1 n=1 Tax=Cinnamomum micranthum f. kanehirae TaxID=337451 RepID=A0A3S3NMM8_9MAGN|nr:myosin-binding protein 1-like protein isoform X1 [Cinnamomum micranthum f. kanehirae]